MHKPLLQLNSVLPRYRGMSEILRLEFITAHWWIINNMNKLTAIDFSCNVIRILRKCDSGIPRIHLDRYSRLYWDISYYFQNTNKKNKLKPIHSLLYLPRRMTCNKVTTTSKKLSKWSLNIRKLLMFTFSNLGPSNGRDS